MFGNLHRREAKAMARLKGTQLYLQDNPMSRYHQNLEKDLQGEICHILFQENDLLKSKSLARWINLGDKNTGFFHKSVILDRNRSRYLSLSNNSGETISTPKAIEDHICTFFSKIYATESLQSQVSPPSNQLSISMGFILTNEETKHAIFSMKGLKAPGPDGFHPIFFQKNRGILWVKIYALILRASSC